MTNPIGNKKAQILLVGEAPGEKEAKAGVPFVGASGQLLASLMSSLGFPVRTPSTYASPDELSQIWEESNLYLTNVARVRPPGNDINKFFLNKTEAKKQGVSELNGKYPRPELTDGLKLLEEEIDEVRPNIIVALGNTALWALTGETGITSWRGSTLSSLEISGHRYKVVPVIHPALVLRKYEWRNLLAHDLRARVLSQYETPNIPEPKYDFVINPSFDTAKRYLEWLLAIADAGREFRLASDIETRFHQISCVGLAWSEWEAICIPFMVVDEPYHYWPSLEEEVYMVHLIKRIHTHENIEITGQGFNFDREHFACHWGFRSRLDVDTMTTHHTCYPGLKKSLDFLSSLYCKYHRYWKEESSNWDPKLGEQQNWIYNCKDACATWEISYEVEEVAKKMGMEQQVAWQHEIQECILTSWLRGVRYDKARRDQMGLDLMQEIQEYRNFFIEMLGTEKLNPNSQAFWCDSPDQLKTLFYDIFKVKPVLNKDKRPTTDKNALPTISKREPLLKPICDALLEYRSLRVYYDTFVKVPLDPRDGRFRCELDPNGTETLRFSSRTDALGVGANVQNVPEGEED